MKEKILHLFMWRIEDIIKNLDKIKSSGWTAILITPVQPSKEEWNNLWYMRYQVTGLSIGNRYGTKEELQELCYRAHMKGIKIYVDVIITHYANAGGGDKQLEIHERVDINLVNNPFFWRERKCINYDDRYSVTHHCNMLPAVRTDNFQYQNLVINFFNELIDVGVDGIRIDSAKMIATPGEFGENNLFFKRVFEEIKKPLYAFGEVIFESKELIEKYQKYIDVLTEFNKDSYSLNKDKMIVFIESHDSFLDDLVGYTSDWKNEKILNNYQFLAKDFQKVLFYVRPMDNTWASDRMGWINNQ